MKKTLTVISAIAISLLSGCKTVSDTKAEFIEEGHYPKVLEFGLRDLERELKDPSSVQYKNALVYWDVNNEKNYCIEYNAKNSYGGYTGFSWALIDKDNVFNDHSISYVCNSMYDRAKELEFQTNDGE